MLWLWLWRPVEHIKDVHERCLKRLNLLKSLCGTSWGANPEIILYTYRTFIRPILEYGCVLFANSDTETLSKIQSIETRAIKIAFDLPPWTTNYWCYQQINFSPILDRIKKLGKDFLNKNKEDFLLKPLIEDCKAAPNGNHGPIFKALKW